MSIHGKVKNRLKKLAQKAVEHIAEHQLPLPIEKMYEFDVQGYTIIRNVIPRDVVDEMNALIDKNQNGDYPRKYPFAELSPLFFELAEHPLIMAVCEQWAGKGFRLDHMQGLQSPPMNLTAFADYTEGDIRRYKSSNMHVEKHEGFRYQWMDNRSHGGLLTFGFSLNEIKQGDGGFVLIPGSHKENISLDAGRLQEAHFAEGSSLLWVQPEFQPGDMMIFTEAFVHGTTPWLVPDKPRRMLYYRYCPGHMCWRPYDEIKKYLPYAKTETMANLLRPPYVASYTETTTEVANPSNSYRMPTLKTKRFVPFK